MTRSGPSVVRRAGSPECQNAATSRPVRPRVFIVQVRPRVGKYVHVARRLAPAARRERTCALSADRTGVIGSPAKSRGGGTSPVCRRTASDRTGRPATPTFRPRESLHAASALSRSSSSRSPAGARRGSEAIRSGRRAAVRAATVAAPAARSRRGHRRAALRTARSPPALGAVYAGPRAAHRRTSPARRIRVAEHAGPAARHRLDHGSTATSPPTST